jgi:hypothetical protein
MKRYIAITILGLALIGCIWHNAVKAQTRTDRFQGNVQVLGTELEVLNATNPALIVKDTTNSVEGKFMALDNYAQIGTASNHDLYLYTNAATVAKLDTSGYFYFTDRLVDLGDTNTYIASSGSDVISIYTNAAEKAKVDATGYFYFTDRLVDLGDTDTYFLSSGSDALSVYTGGSVRTAWSTTLMTQSVPIDVAGHYISLTERASPGDPGADKVIMFAYDDAGTTKWCLAFPGASSVICPHADPL